MLQVSRNQNKTSAGRQSPNISQVFNIPTFIHDDDDEDENDHDHDLDDDDEEEDVGDDLRQLMRKPDKSKKVIKH